MDVPSNCSKGVLTQREKNKTRAFRRHAALNAGRRGWSAASLARKYYAYVRSGDWRSVLDKAKAVGMRCYGTHRTHGTNGLPKEFVKWLRARCENTRCAAATFSDLPDHAFCGAC